MLSPLQSVKAATAGTMADLLLPRSAKPSTQQHELSGSYQYSNEREWQADYDREYNRAYGAAAAGATRERTAT